MSITGSQESSGFIRGEEINNRIGKYLLMVRETADLGSFCQ